MHVFQKTWSEGGIIRSFGPEDCLIEQTDISRYQEACLLLSVIDQWDWSGAETELQKLDFFLSENAISEGVLRGLALKTKDQTGLIYIVMPCLASELQWQNQHKHTKSIWSILNANLWHNTSSMTAYRKATQQNLKGQKTWSEFMLTLLKCLFEPTPQSAAFTHLELWYLNSYQITSAKEATLVSGVIWIVFAQ